MKEWDASKYPDDYVAGFIRPDDEAIDDVAMRVLNERGVSLEYVSVRREPEGVVVYVAHRKGKTTTKRQVNWADPEKLPRDYPKYARSFIQFSGPEEVQTRRAELLARRLHTQFKKEPDTR